MRVRLLETGVHDARTNCRQESGQGSRASDPLQSGHLSLRLLLITSQSRQKTAFKRGRPPASNRFFAGSTIHTNLIAGNGQLPFEKSMASITRVHRLSKVSADRSEKASA